MTSLPGSKDEEKTSPNDVNEATAADVLPDDVESDFVSTEIPPEAPVAAVSEEMPPDSDSKQEARVETEMEQPTKPSDAATTTTTGETQSATTAISRMVSSPGAFSMRGPDGAASDDPENDEDEFDEGPPPVNDLETGTVGTTRNDTTVAIAGMPQQQLPQDPIVEAVAVQDDLLERAQIEEEIRNTILQEAVQADVIPVQVPDVIDERMGDNKEPNSMKHILCGVVSLVLLLVLVLGLGLGLSKEKDDVTTNNMENTKRPTLEVVRERGYVRCGMNNLGFASIIDPEQSDQLAGFNVQQCRVMASLVFGDPDKFEQVWVTPFSRFELLADGTVDITTEGTTHTMGRDVYEANTRSSFTFSTPYFYSGLAFGGVPTYVDCADNLEDFRGDCRGLQICAAAGTTHLAVLSEVLGGGTIVPYNGTDTLVERFLSGTCNVIASEPIFLTKFSAVYDDPEWSALADIAVNAFFLAEANNISKDQSDKMADLALSNKGTEAELDLISSLTTLIAEFGHHGDLYSLHIEDKVPRQDGLNTVYDKESSTGLLYSIPLGKITELGPSPVANGTLSLILEQNYLVCGVMPTKGPAFVSSSKIDSYDSLWSGFDIEFCRGLAASLFAGDSSRVVFVEVQDMTDAYGALANGSVDVVAGARVTLQAGIQEPTTGLGYKFSSPYYYDNESRDAFAFMMLNTDPQWNDFVYWIVMGVIFAEEEGITAETSVDMPIVSLFGEKLKQMFRDCVASVGNYAELYNATLQDVVPRGGANRLNEGLAGPQLFPINLS
ncbi:extracellular solute-binding protein [Seminavis robusta]|uniref:Extracellular solute-binding protein n=1 Tax=Seminavis robusta TaxID=568900 RepID=A0A9N8ELY2_9STRA|nr:extracellular solute-binding protein [Seminavis robusta]|eukprot:Sro1225_g254050.1 extracellular solute-binding protein (779) ;mRNA; r:1345-3975